MLLDIFLLGCFSYFSIRLTLATYFKVRLIGKNQSRNRHFNILLTKQHEQYQQYDVIKNYKTLRCPISQIFAFASFASFTGGNLLLDNNQAKNHRYQGLSRCLKSLTLKATEVCENCGSSPIVFICFKHLIMILVITSNNQSNVMKLL